MGRTLSSGNEHSLAINPEGKVYSFGLNSYGQLGLGSAHGEPSHPMIITSYLVLKGLEDPTIVSVSAGGNHSLFLTEDSRVFTCGWNSHGQISQSGYSDRSKPVAIQKYGYEGEYPTIVKISAGGFHSLLLDDQGRVWAVGRSNFKQLGLEISGVLDFIRTPLLIKEFYERASPPVIVKISAGKYHSLLLDSDGNVWICTDGNETYKPQVLPTPTKIKEISAGPSHDLLLDINGQVWGAGTNDHGVIGQPQIGASFDEPVKITHEGRMVAIVASNAHSLMLDDQGQVWGLGSNLSGRLGLGEEGGDYSIPTLISHLPPIVEISAGEEFSLFLDLEGHLWACGDNTNGQLGFPTIRHTPRYSDERRTPKEIPYIIIQLPSEEVDNGSPPLTTYPIIEHLFELNRIVDFRLRSDLGLIEVEDDQGRLYFLKAEYDPDADRILKPPPDNYFEVLERGIKTNKLKIYDYLPEYDLGMNKGFEFILNNRKYLILVQSVNGQIYRPV